jgi:hypothetical protein
MQSDPSQLCRAHSQNSLKFGDSSPAKKYLKNVAHLEKRDIVDTFSHA